jgi:hypothetical protein
LRRRFRKVITAKILPYNLAEFAKYDFTAITVWAAYLDDAAVFETRACSRQA